MLSRVAVYQVPVSLAGVAAVAGISETAARVEAERWRRLALVHVDGSAGTDLWLVYGLLRSWLLAPGRLPAEERQAAHRAAGDFLFALGQQDREIELGLGWVACLLEARAQYLAAGEYGPARAATDRISGVYNRQGLYGDVERLNKELLRYERHDDSFAWIAKSHLLRANFDAARTWFQKIGGEIEARPLIAEAAMMYGLGSVDLRTGKLVDARYKFEKALEIHRSIAERAAEAADLHGLASVSTREWNHSRARELFSMALAIHREFEEKAGEADIVHELAWIDLREGDSNQARMGFEKSLSIRRRIEDRAGEASSLNQLAWIDLNEGNMEAAHDKFDGKLVCAPVRRQAFITSDGSNSGEMI
jgi:tetratricopeptide (TPR) repeat protein